RLDVARALHDLARHARERAFDRALVQQQLAPLVRHASAVPASEESLERSCQAKRGARRLSTAIRDGVIGDREPALRVQGSPLSSGPNSPGKSTGRRRMNIPIE